MGYREFENEDPIDETLVVLDLLADRRMGSVSREIVRTGRREKAESYVEIGHHHDFGDSRYYLFRVTERVVEALVTGNLVRGKPEWGYTDMKRLRINDFGSHYLWEERKRLGLHEDLRADWWFMGRYG